MLFFISFSYVSVIYSLVFGDLADTSICVFSFLEDSHFTNQQCGITVHFSLKRSRQLDRVFQGLCRNYRFSLVIHKKVPTL